MEKPRIANHLIHETSPYLLQHAENPVDWYPWGEEAMERAHREEKAIFLSIGYSACHWCHVMAHESFEDEKTAAIMNEHFINIKVDREERPDLDHIYMSAVQVMTNHGGWPMSVFLTPDLKPFYGGTYFPPEDKMGMPSFQRILSGVANAWKTRRKELLASAGELTTALRDLSEMTSEVAAPTLLLIDNAVQVLSQNFDASHGGFGEAPKFFHTMDMRVSLRHWKRTGNPRSLFMVTHTLDQMAAGGIHDQLGGGFHRYSTDAEWLAPHFEKMLYDNALLTQLYLEAYQATKKELYQKIARETLDFVLREMTSPDGPFYSTLDADSEGKEGTFYVWSFDEVMEILGSELGNKFACVYDVTSHGNWERFNIIRQVNSLEKAANTDVSSLWKELEDARSKLWSAREKRPRPFRDEKSLVAWSGLMIGAMAFGYQVLGETRYLETARGAARFILEKLWDPKTKRLLHSYKDGRARFDAFLDDYACLLDALITLYESDFDPRWLQDSLQLGETMVKEFWDESSRSFYYTGRNHEKLIIRTKDFHDGAIPSSTSMAVTALFRLGKMVSNTSLLKISESILQSFSVAMEKFPTAMGQMLLGVDFLLNHQREIVVVPGSTEQENDAVLKYLRSQFLPNTVILSVQTSADWKAIAELTPLVSDKKSLDGKPTIYLCENFVCHKPLVGLQELTERLGSEFTARM